MDYIIQIISVIGSLASIIALPIAIIQILKVKEKIDDANAITNKFINYINNEKLETVFKGLEIQHNNMLSIKTSYKKPGTRWNDIQNSVENTIRMINEYCHKIPSEHNEIESLLHDVIISLTSFVELSDNNKESSIVEAESTLRSCINMIKSELEKKHRAEIEIISKSE